MSISQMIHFLENKNLVSKPVKETPSRPWTLSRIVLGVDKKDTKVKTLLGIFSCFYEDFLISKFQQFIGLVDRKLIKNAVMTLFYGSSSMTLLFFPLYFTIN